MAYTAVVVVTAAHHEMWRDEVVALSIARRPSSLVELWHTSGHEGHPLLWYVCLRYLYLLFGTTAVLPVWSVVVAVAAVAILLACAPLPLWVKTLFVFGYFPLFEYAVVTRGYGLGMLLLFAFCALYPRRRDHPVAVALMLAALANTSVLGFVVAGAAGAMIVIDRMLSTARLPLSGRHYAAIAIYTVGLAIMPPTTTPAAVTDFSALIGAGDLGLVANGLVQTLRHPIGHSVFVLWVPFASLCAWLLFGRLLRRPALFAFCFLSLVSFELFFTLVYPAAPRHAGYVLLVVMATLWIGSPWRGAPTTSAAADGGGVARWVDGVLMIPLALALCFQVYLASGFVIDEIRLEYSSSRRLGALIAADPRLHQAIVIGEPENLIQSLPYYRENRIYLPQERVFRDWLQPESVSLSLSQEDNRLDNRNLRLGRRSDYDLGELLVTASELRERHGVPIVIALGWWLDGPELQRAYAESYFEQTFTISAEAREAFRARTEHLGTLRAASFTDENYDVFVLR